MRSPGFPASRTSLHFVSCCGDRARTFSGTFAPGDVLWEDAGNTAQGGPCPPSVSRRWWSVMMGPHLPEEGGGKRHLEGLGDWGVSSPLNNVL